MKGLTKVIECENNDDCINNFGSKNMVCNKDNICENLQKIKNNKLDIFEECISNSQCKSGKCGSVQNDKIPLPFYYTVKNNNVCIDSGEKMIKQLENIKAERKKKKKL